MFEDRRHASRCSGSDSPGCRRAETEAKVEFYVTDDCNGCGLCKSIAPNFFDCVEYAYPCFIIRQPRTKYEVELLRHASDLRVLDAIRQTANP